MISALGSVPADENNNKGISTNEIASVFNDGFGMEEVDEKHLSNPSINNILSGFTSNKAVVEIKNVLMF